MNLHQKEVRLFKTRLVMDKRDIIKRIITAMSELDNLREENKSKVGVGYKEWREELYKKMTHYSTKLEPTPKKDGDDAAPEAQSQSASKSGSGSDSKNKSTPSSSSSQSGKSLEKDNQKKEN